MNEEICEVCQNFENTKKQISELKNKYIEGSINKYEFYTYMKNINIPDKLFQEFVLDWMSIT